jgi:hypothetical protein
MVLKQVYRFTFYLPPDVGKFIEDLPRGQKTARVVEAIRESPVFLASRQDQE